MIHLYCLWLCLIWWCLWKDASASFIYSPSRLSFFNPSYSSVCFPCQSNMSFDPSNPSPVPEKRSPHDTSSSDPSPPQASSLRSHFEPQVAILLPVLKASQLSQAMLALLDMVWKVAFLIPTTHLQFIPLISLNNLFSILGKMVHHCSNHPILLGAWMSI